MDDVRAILQKVTEERDGLTLELERLKINHALEIPNEAGFSMNFQMAHDVIGSAQITLRGARADDWAHVMNQAREFGQYAFKNGWKFKAGPVSAPPPKSAPVEQESPVADGDTPQANIPSLPDGYKAWLTIVAARVVVKPEPGDMVTVEFYAAGHKWPDIKANKWKVERAQGLLKHVTSHDVRKPADMSLACTVYYLNGKEKADKPGEFWKDVYHVRPDNF